MPTKSRAKRNSLHLSHKQQNIALDDGRGRPWSGGEGLEVSGLLHGRDGRGPVGKAEEPRWIVEITETHRCTTSRPSGGAVITGGRGGSRPINTAAVRSPSATRLKKLRLLILLSRGEFLSERSRQKLAPNASSSVRFVEAAPSEIFVSS